LEKGAGTLYWCIPSQKSEQHAINLITGSVRSVKALKLHPIHSTPSSCTCIRLWCSCLNLEQMNENKSSP